MERIASSTGIDDPTYVVRRRLMLVNRLTGAKEPTTGVDELIYMDHRWFAFPSKDYQGLRCYLLLTCFDLLGKYDSDQAASSAWHSPGNGSEHTEEENLHELRKTLHQGYNRDYLVRTNFQRFIDTMLPADQRNKLLDSINIIKKDKITDEALPYDITDREKLKLLFDIRGSYMLKGITPATGMNKFAFSDTQPLTDEPLDSFYRVVQFSPSVLTRLIEDVLNRG